MTEKEYNEAAEKLVSWVEDCNRKKHDPELVSILLLDKAFSLCFHVFGKDRATDALNSMMWEKITEIDEQENN